MTAKKKDTLEEVDDFLSTAILIPIPLKTGTKKYRIEAVSFKTGLVLQAQMASTEKQLGKGTKPASVELDGVDEGNEEEYLRSVLGDAYDEMAEDGVSGPAIQHILAIVLAWTFAGFERAKEYYDTGGKAPAANRAARRTATQTRQGAGSTTPKPASANTTKPKKATPSKKS